MLKMLRIAPAYSYYLEKPLNANETVIIGIPEVSPNKRSVRSIGYSGDDTIALYATISADPDNTAQWAQVPLGNDINLSTTAIKVVNGVNATTFSIRVILE